MTRPCLVYVEGPRGPEPQVWHDPMVTPAGKLAIAPPCPVVRGPFPLPEHLGPSPCISAATLWDVREN